jgi:hypothetical protein
MIAAPANSEPDFYGAIDPKREDRPAAGTYAVYRDLAKGKATCG